MATVAVLGGGISGLSCAYYLSSLGKSKVKYVILLEKSSRFGGWIQTTKYPDGAVCEHGPRTLRVAGKQGYNAVALAEELSLKSYILPIKRGHPAARKNLILVDKKLHPLPKSPKYLFRTVPPFSKPLWRYLLTDLSTKCSPVTDDTVYNFGKRRFGEEVAKYVFDPMCRGIAAGDSKEISIRSMFRSLYDAEKDHGSVLKGLVKQTQSRSLTHITKSDLAFQARQEFWSMWSMKGGLHQLVDALACAIEDSGRADIHVNAECSRLRFEDKAIMTVDGEDLRVDHIFSCIPAKELGDLLPQYPALKNTLSSISAVTVATVYMEYAVNVIREEAFGFLVPSSEDSKVLGIVFDSCCFPELNGIHKSRITCMIGGKWFYDILGDPDVVSSETILELAIAEVKKHLGIIGLPDRYNVSVHKNCIPQYLVGHHKKLEDIEKEISEKQLSLSLLGASYSGAGVPDCIYNARLEVEKFLHIESE